MALCPCGRAEGPDSAGKSLDDFFLNGDRLESDQIGLIELEGHALLIFGLYTLQADRIVWDARWQRLKAEGHVRFSAPDYSAAATALAFDFARELLEMGPGSILYQDLLELKVGQATLTPQLLTAQQATVRIPGLALAIQAEAVRFLPQLDRHNLLLENASLADIPLALPQLTLSVATGDLPGQLPLAISADEGWLVPRLGFEAGQIKLETRLRLYEDDALRLDNLLDYRPDRGWQESLGFQWRPGTDWLLASRLDLAPVLRGSQQIFYQVSQAQLAQVHLGFNEEPRFERHFELPLQPRQQSEAFFAQAHWFSALQTLGEWPLDFRYRLGLGYGSDSHWMGSGGLELVTHPLALSREHFLLFNGRLAYLVLAGEHLFAGGGRVLWEARPRPDFHFGLYLDQWLASVPAGWLAKPDLLRARLGHYLVYRPLEALALGALMEISPYPFRFVTLDALISYRYPPLTSHLLLQALPIGAQARVEFDFF